MMILLYYNMDIISIEHEYNKIIEEVQDFINDNPTNPNITRIKKYVLNKSKFKFTDEFSNLLINEFELFKVIINYIIKIIKIKKSINFDKKLNNDISTVNSYNIIFIVYYFIFA